MYSQCLGYYMTQKHQSRLSRDRLFWGEMQGETRVILSRTGLVVMYWHHYPGDLERDSFSLYMGNDDKRRIAWVYRCPERHGQTHGIVGSTALEVKTWLGGLRLTAAPRNGGGNKSKGKRLKSGKRR